MIYESKRAALLTDKIALRATLLPKLMHARINETTRQTIKELTGTSDPGRTWRIHSDNGNPLEKSA